VTRFGAFVDIGVHQDGLVHMSELANRFVKDASEVVKVGQIVKVQVLNADPKAKRIALSMKALEVRARPEPPKKQEVKKPEIKKQEVTKQEVSKPTLESQIAFLGSKFRVKP